MPCGRKWIGTVIGIFLIGGLFVPFVTDVDGYYLAAGIDAAVKKIESIYLKLDSAIS